MSDRFSLSVHLPILAVLGLLGAAFFFHLAAFPGLHADEAWFGMRVLEISKNGVSSVHGMNRYTGALFPNLIAASFSVSGANIFALRFPGALLNGLTLVVLIALFWKQGRIALYLPLLFGSSLLLLFNSRVAWEVCALQNLPPYRSTRTRGCSRRSTGRLLGASVVRQRARRGRDD